MSLNYEKRIYKILLNAGEKTKVMQCGRVPKLCRPGDCLKSIEAFERLYFTTVLLYSTEDAFILLYKFSLILALRDKCTSYNIVEFDVSIGDV